MHNEIAIRWQQRMLCCHCFDESSHLLFVHETLSSWNLLLLYTGVDYSRQEGWVLRYLRIIIYHHIWFEIKATTYTETAKIYPNKYYAIVCTCVGMTVYSSVSCPSDIMFVGLVFDSQGQTGPGAGVRLKPGPLLSSETFALQWAPSILLCLKL